MCRDYRSKKLLYHVTALDNLESILKYGLLSRAEAEEEGVLRADVADSEIVRKRRDLGILRSVPFHFFEPTPFTDCIFKRYPGTTFVAITILRDYALKNSQNFLIATRHPLSSKVEILPYDEGIDRIDWKTMARREYSDEECRSVCMAECLSLSAVPPQVFHCIYVPDKETQDRVNSLKGNFNFFVDIMDVFSRKAINE